MTTAQWKSIRVGQRVFRRQLDKAIRKSWMRALAELITNADDSCARLEAQGAAVSGDIYVEYQRERRGARFFVTDEAEGMTAERMAEVFEVYGGEAAAGDDARGFFNRGAKDALLSMDSGYEESICDGEFARVDLRIHNGEPQVRIAGPAKATPARRRDMGLRPKANGTVASFALPGEVQVPHYETVRTALATFWMLRKIVDPQNSRRQLILISGDRDEEIIFSPPIGEVLIDRKSLSLEVDGFPKFSLQVTLKKADEDLDQSLSDRRVGGLLVLDEGDAVLDLTMGRFDRDPAAAPFFGELKIRRGFKKFLKKQEQRGDHVLSDERNGLERHHPWVEGLLREVESLLEPYVEKERRARAAESQELSAAERKHHDKILEELNRIAEEETRKAWEGLDDDELRRPPPSGLEIRPAKILIAEGATRYAAVVGDFDKVRPGDLIYVQDDPDVIDLEPDVIKVERDNDDDKTFVGYFKISGGNVGDNGKIIALANDAGIVAEATFEVVADTYPEFEGVMAFHPDATSVVDQKASTLRLLVRTDVVGPGEAIEVISSDPSMVVVLSDVVRVDASAVRGGVARVPVRVRGQGVGNSAIVTATRAGVGSATVHVHVRSQATPPKGKKGLFREIVYSAQASDRERVHYDDGTGNIVIHLAAPTVAHHLGGTGEYKHLLDSQTLVAELVTQCVAEEVARRKIESGARVYFDRSAAGQMQEDLAEIRHLIHTHGLAIHRVVVDQQLLRDVRRG